MADDPNAPAQLTISATEAGMVAMRVPKPVHWEPKQDITAYELAMAIPIVLSSWGPLSFVEDHIAALAPDVRRHFRVGDK